MRGRVKKLKKRHSLLLVVILERFAKRHVLRYRPLVIQHRVCMRELFHRSKARVEEGGADRGMEERGDGGRGERDGGRENKGRSALAGTNWCRGSRK